MRKDRYVQAFTSHLPWLRKLAMSSGLDYDDANEVLGKCAETLLKKKQYASIRPGSLKGFLRTHLRFKIQHFKRAIAIQVNNVARIPDADEYWKNQDSVKVSNGFNIPDVEERECPFCFHGNLNQYGGHAMCRTIIPSHMRIQKKGYSITEESLAVVFDFDKMIDVQKAVARLAPLEQRVVRACVLGNESLESFAFENAYSKSRMVRVWVEARTKLQQYLHEYAPRTPRKQTVAKVRRAFEAVQSEENRENT